MNTHHCFYSTAPQRPNLSGFQYTAWFCVLYSGTYRVGYGSVKDSGSMPFARKEHVLTATFIWGQDTKGFESLQINSEIMRIHLRLIIQ